MNVVIYDKDTNKLVVSGEVDVDMYTYVLHYFGFTDAECDLDPVAMHDMPLSRLHAYTMINNLFADLVSDDPDACLRIGVWSALLRLDVYFMIGDKLVRMTSI